MSVFFVNRACVSIYEIIKRYNGNMTHIEKLLISAGMSSDEIYSKFMKTLNILNGNMEYITKDATDLNYPYFAHIDITSACNMHCVHCLNPSENYFEDDMDTTSWLRAIDQLARIGVSILWIGGGEPLLRTDLPDILAYAKSHKMQIVLATNGLLMDLNRARVLAPLIDELTVCLDGSIPSIHEFFRKPEHTYEAILENLRSIIPVLHENNCLIKVFTCVARHNLYDVPGIIDLSAKLGVDSWACQTLVPMNRGATVREEIISPEMRTQLAEIIQKKAVEYDGQLQVQKYVPLSTMEEVYSQPKMECAAGNAILYIASNGNIYPCSRLVFQPFLVGKISNMDLKKAWLSHPTFQLFRNVDYEGTQCAKCKHFQAGMCNGGCKAEKYRAYGSLFDHPDPNCSLME